MGNFINNISGFLKTQDQIIILAVVIGFFLNQYNCVDDPTCDPDPEYGGCPSSCESGSFKDWVVKSSGVWIVLNLGSMMGKEKLKDRKYLKEFLAEHNLRFDVRMIEEEWKKKDKLSK